MNDTERLKDPRFIVYPGERFIGRWGGLGRDAEHSELKLCLVATDPLFLIDVVFGLSLRPDCWHVKFGLIERDGMYLARCWLASDEAAARLCQELKAHPRLMVSIQNDAFFDAFRQPRKPDEGFGVWDEWSEHHADVLRVHQRAFGRDDEAAIVRAVREANACVISLVVGVAPEVDHQPWPITGHVLFSPVTTSANERAAGLALAPLAVVPEQQRKGMGSALVAAGLRRAKALGYAYVVVLGNPDYYSRLGFVPAAEYGLQPERAAWKPHFLAQELWPGAHEGVSGTVEYHPAFD